MTRRGRRIGVKRESRRKSKMVKRVVAGSKARGINMRKNMKMKLHRRGSKIKRFIGNLDRQIKLEEEEQLEGAVEMLTKPY